MRSTTLVGLGLGALALLGPASPIQAGEADPPNLAGRVIAAGIPGAGAVAAVGIFHPGGPIRDKPDFADFAKPGRILDAKRVLVTSWSNFGAPRAQADAPEGAVLSLDPDGDPIVVPPDFAAQGGQASALNGRVQLFTAQSPGFINGLNNPKAATATLPPVSNPLGISINNAFGRLWFANAPHGVGGIGTDSIVDPGGQPLAGAPSALAGGVFAGDQTNRPGQVVPGGLRSAAMANALLGMSPDGSKRAVFAVLTADGAIAQAHAAAAIDGLAPPGTITPLDSVQMPGANPPAVTRAGMIFNWVPNRILYVTDPGRNAIVALPLATDQSVFRPGETRIIAHPALSNPVDLAPAVPEVANGEFSSNTSLAGGSDFYVANRGNGTILRMRQDGTVLAVRRVTIGNGRALGAGLLNGIAVSPDAQRIWLTVSGTLPGYATAPGALIEVPAFGPGRSAMHGNAEQSTQAALIAEGERLFRMEFTPTQGLGPLFNGRSCGECHRDPTVGGMGQDGLAVVHRVGRVDGDAFDPLHDRGGPVARAHSIAALGIPCALAPGVPAAANLVSMRNSPALYGAGLIDAIPDQAIRAGATKRGEVQGRPNLLRDNAGNERVGRFGWKADVATLEQFVADAFRNELGITSPQAPIDQVASGSDCGAVAHHPKDDGQAIQAVTAYVKSLPPPSPASEQIAAAGAAVFAATGCGDCHVPGFAVDGRVVPLYSDLLLHDLGPGLKDGVVQGEANGAEWRTTPLWGLGVRRRLLHDGRATSITEAIQAHGAAGASSAQRFRQLPDAERGALLAFLSAL